MLRRALLCSLCFAPMAFGQPSPPAKWLVDLGRDYPLTPQASPSDADAEITLLLMQAAGVVDPKLSEAHLWQFDLLSALDRQADARRALEAYVKTRPDDVVARMRLIALTADSLQMAEARAQFCRNELEDQTLAPEIVSDLRRRIAEFHWNRAEREAAEKQALTALEAFEWNIPARALLEEIRGTKDTEAARIERLLWLLRVGPGNIDAARRLGRELLRAGLHAEADRFLKHALALNALLPPGTPPPDLLVERAGALLGTGQVDEAANLIENVAANAALPEPHVIRALIAERRGDNAAAEQERTRLDPDARAVEGALTRSWRLESPQTQPADARLRELVAAFPADVLEYPLNPGKFVSIRIEAQKAEFASGEPWVCTFELRNIGPFAISLGEKLMLDPEILCAVETRGDQVRSSGPTLRVSLHRRYRLKPGESIRTTQTLDIGWPIRAAMIATPQVAHEVEVTGVVQPVRLVDNEGQEVWAPGIGGQVLKPVQFRRSPILATSDEMRSLVAGSRSNNVQQRILATQRLGMLIAERQHLAAGRLSYAARHVRIEEIQPAVLARAEDGDWQVRAHLAEVLRWFVLDRTATQTATQLLRDPQWLVRGLAARALADQHGAKFQPALQTLSKSDPESWVRRFDTALLQRISATTQPAASAEPTAEPPRERPVDIPPSPVPLALPE